MVLGRLGNFERTFAVKTLLRWILMGRKDQSFINASVDLEQFWSLESFGTLPKTHPNRLTKDKKKTVNIIENTGEFVKGKYKVGLLCKDDNPISVI